MKLTKAGKKMMIFEFLDGRMLLALPALLLVLVTILKKVFSRRLSVLYRAVAADGEGSDLEKKKVDRSGCHGTSGSKYPHYCGCHNPVYDILEQHLLDALPDVKTPENPVQHRKQSLLISGGIIRPLVNGDATAQVESLGIHNGTVVATGTLDEVMAKMNALSVKYDTLILKPNHCLVPGFIDPHVHIAASAVMRGWTDFSPFEGQNLHSSYSEEWLEQTIRRVMPTDKSKWIVGHGADPAMMKFRKRSGPDGLNVLVRFTTEYFDRLSSDVPILILSASMHTAYVNTVALRQVYKKNPKLKGEFPTFDDYRHSVDEAGGIQEISGITPAVLSIPAEQLTKEVGSIFQNLTKLYKEASSRGITTLYDAALSEGMIAILKAYSASHRKLVKLGGARMVVSLEEAKLLDQFKRKEEYHELYYGHCKLVSDGSNQGLTGFQFEQFCCEPKGNVGNFNFGDGKHDKHPDKLPTYFKSLVKVIIDKKWPMMIHANGLKAVEFTLQAFENAIDPEEKPLRRHRIEHCSLLEESQIDRMAKYGVSPSFLIGHVGYWGYVFNQAIFEQKSLLLDRCASALKKGLRITFHSDNSVSPFGPLRMAEQSITRIMEGSREKQLVLNKDECVTAEQALRAITYDAAWQCNADNWCGSLAPGKHADFVVLEKDPLQLESHVGLRDLRILRTVVQGAETYNNDTN